MESQVKAVWIGKVAVSPPVKIFSYVKSESFDLVTVPSKDVVHVITNGKTEASEIDCLEVKEIVITTPDLLVDDAEEFVEEKAQMVADFLGFLQKEHVTTEIRELNSADGKQKRAYASGYNQLESDTTHYPQTVKLTDLEKLDADTIASLSNYNFAMQHNHFGKFTGLYKVIELNQLTNKIHPKFTATRDVLSHGRLDRKRTVEKAKEILKKLSFHPTYNTEREKLSIEVHELKEIVQEKLREKIGITWLNNIDLVRIQKEKESQ